MPGRLNRKRAQIAAKLRGQSAQASTKVGAKAKEIASNIVNPNVTAGGTRKRALKPSLLERARIGRPSVKKAGLGDKIKKARLRAATKLREKGMDKAANIANPFVNAAGSTKKKYKAAVTNPRFKDGGKIGEKVNRLRRRVASKLRGRGMETAANIVNPMRTPSGKLKRKYDRRSR